MSTLPIIKNTTITITGDVPSKKNSKRIIHARGRILIIPSQNHKDWHEQASYQLLKAPKNLKKITSISAAFYPSTKRKGDLSNKWESVGDLLVDCGIIEDDNWYSLPRLVLLFAGVDKKNPRTVIYIETEL